jgi:hypothetical protein
MLVRRLAVLWIVECSPAVFWPPLLNPARELRHVSTRPLIDVGKEHYASAYFCDFNDYARLLANVSIARTNRTTAASQWRPDRRRGGGELEEVQSVLNPTLYTPSFGLGHQYLQR